jgi:hypothetical protein
MKYMRLYDINHNILTELSEYNTLIHSFALNALGKCSFNVPLFSAKCIPANFQTFNCLELWDNITNVCDWWGVIAYAVPNGSQLSVMCYDYLYITQKTAALAETLSGTVQSIMTSELNKFNTMANRDGTPAPMLIANHTESSTLIVNNVVYSDEDYYKRLQNICALFNYDFDIDSNFNFNYYLKKGSDKFQYSVNFGTGDADNISGNPNYGMDPSNMANRIIYNGEVAAEDIVSQGIYGTISAPTTVSLNGGTTQDVTNAINAELQRISYPSISINCDIVDSNFCPFNNVGIGDRIVVNLPKYLNFNASMRIIEMTFDDMTSKCTLNLGNIMYRPQPQLNKIYVR